MTAESCSTAAPEDIIEALNAEILAECEVGNAARKAWTVSRTRLAALLKRKHLCEIAGRRSAALAADAAKWERLTGHPLAEVPDA